MASETEAAAGNSTINPQTASTAVETPFMVMAAVMDAAAAPDANNSGSDGVVDVGSGEMAVTIAMATATVTSAMTTTAEATVAAAAMTTPASAAAAATTTTTVAAAAATIEASIDDSNRQ